MHLQKILYICSLMLLLALIWSCKDQIIVSPASLTVILTATPVSGQAPLQGVDLSAQVSGGTKESVTYRFDCTGDGIFDAESTTDDETFTATDVCSYDDPGIYTAMVVIERGDFSANSTININVAAPSVAPTTTGDTVFVEMKDNFFSPREATVWTVYTFGGSGFSNSSGS